MTYYQRREANRFYWMVKGMLIPESWSEEEVMKIYNSYMERLWGNHERNSYSASGFEAAWLEREGNKYTQRQWDRTVGWGEVPEEYKYD